MPNPKIGLDIDARLSRVLQADFLEWDLGVTRRKVVTLGNPPFGKNASLARRFFNHAASFSDVIAMIVPRTFEKVSMQNKLNLNMHLCFEHVLPQESFSFEGRPYAVPTVFQIWQKKPEPREKVKSLFQHPDFNFVSSDLAHFAFQRVGARAGLVSIEGLRKSPNSHYFLRANKCSDNLMAVLSSIDWDTIKWRTAGNPSIGKSELVLKYTACTS